MTKFTVSLSHKVDRYCELVVEADSLEDLNARMDEVWDAADDYWDDSDGYDDNSEVTPAKEDAKVNLDLTKE